MRIGQAWKPVVARINRKRRDADDRARRKRLERIGLEDENPAFAMVLEALTWLEHQQAERGKRLNRLVSDVDAAAESSRVDPTCRRLLRHVSRSLRQEIAAKQTPLSAIAIVAKFAKTAVGDWDRQERHRDPMHAARDTWIRCEAKRLVAAAPGISQAAVARKIAEDLDQHRFGARLSPERIREIAFKRPRLRRK